MEQSTNIENLITSTPEEPTITPATEEKPKNHTGLKIITILACISALSGIGFGVWSIIQNHEKDSQLTNKDNQISALKTQVEDSEKTIAALKKAQTSDDSQTTSIDDTIKTGASEIIGGPYIENGYFYVPHWGVKYKLSDELTNYGYAVEQESMTTSSKDDRYIVSLTGVKKTEIPSEAQAQTFDNIFTCSMVLIQRDTKKYADEVRSTMPAHTFIDYDNNYTFTLSNMMTSLISTCGINRETAKATSEIILNDILSHPEAI